MGMMNKISRHPITVRLTHWAVALSGFALLFSGFGELPMYKRYKLASLPGMGWAADFTINLKIHYLAAFIFTFAVIFHIFYHWRRKEYAAMPRKGDMKESWQIMKAMFTKGEEPPSGKFLAEQRVAYAAIGVVSVVLILTGLIKVYKNTGTITFDPTFMQVITLIHTASTMLFMFLVIFHLAAFIIKANRPLLPSMFNGKVDADYAKHRHPLWKTDKK